MFVRLLAIVTAVTTCRHMVFTSTEAHSMGYRIRASMFCAMNPSTSFVFIDFALHRSPSDCQVRDRESDKIIGRIKLMHENTNREAVSVYCRMHGCSPPLTRSINAPSHIDMLRWFKAGQAWAITVHRGHPQARAKMISVGEEWHRAM